MFKVTGEAAERVSKELTDAKFNLKALFTTLQTENPKVADYIKSQADKSRHPMEVYGTGIVVYLLLKNQWEIDATDADPVEELKKFQDFLDKTDLSKIPPDPNNPNSS